MSGQNLTGERENGPEMRYYHQGQHDYNPSLVAASANPV